MQLAIAGRFRTDEQFLNFDTQMLDRVRALPGVEAAGTSHFLQLGRIIPGTGFWRADQPRPAQGDEPVTEVLVIMPATSRPWTSRWCAAASSATETAPGRRRRW